MLPDFEPMRQRLEAKGISNGEQFCRQLLEETGVAILPGSSFGRPKKELTARIAFVDFDGARALAAVEQLPGDQPLDESFLRTHCERVLIAIDKLCDWIQ